MVRSTVLCAIGTACLAYGAVWYGTREDPSRPNADGSIPGLTSTYSRQVTSEMVRITFRNIAEGARLRFRHFPATRRSLLPEDMGSGLAWGDFDGDGDDDLFLVNFVGSVLDPIDPQEKKGRCALFRNDGDGKFTDVSAVAGVALTCFGMAAAWGDYDNDGDLDLYVTCYGPNVLLQNNGDGTFVDVTKAAGVGDDRFSAGCAWGDYNSDGHIDLYVCTYVQFEYREDDRDRTSDFFGSETPHTINPSAYPPDTNVLYRNNGDGTFTDVAEMAGVADSTGRSLEAAWFDFDSDGRVDLYVANDVSSNGVFHNRGDGTLADIGASSLAADYRGAMGLAVGDYDHDSDQDLFVTHWVAQENAFFENTTLADGQEDAGQRRILFMDSAYRLGVGQVSLKMVGWATSFVDFDNDGNVDLWVVNGNTLQEAGDNTRLKPQQMHIFRQQPPRGFFEMGAQACPLLKQPFVGRGGAHADFDGDGKMDLAVVVYGGAPLLLWNTSANAGHWLRVQLRQNGANTRALGARVTVKTGDRTQTAQVGSDGSYLSQCSIDSHFGLGASDVVDLVTIHWPDGQLDRLKNITADQRIVVTHDPTYRTQPPPEPDAD